MKLPLGITLTLTLLLLNFQQASTQIPDSWERNNYTIYDNNSGDESFNEETPAEPTGENDLANIQITPQNNESRSENDGFGSVYYSGDEQQDQNSSVTTPMPPAADVLPSNDTEEESSEILPTTTPPSIPFNSSYEFLDTSAELNETETQETGPSNFTSEPTQTPEADFNGTYSDPKPENSTEDSSQDETGSGYLDVPAEIPATTIKNHEENMENVTAVTPPVIPEIETAAAPDIWDKEANLNRSYDTRGDLANGMY